MSTRKSLGFALVVGLFAVVSAAVPAVASAVPQLTGQEIEKGKFATVPIGTTITLTSTNAQMVYTGGSAISCEHVVFNGIVKKNNGAEVEVEMDGANDTATGCKLAGAEWSTTPTLESLNLTSASKTFKFTYSISPTGWTETSTSTVTYTSGSKTIHVEGPVGGTKAGTFKGDFAASYVRKIKAAEVVQPVIFD